jgi:pimeloyl-ACP methyl ester carboxylesterase
VQAEVSAGATHDATAVAEQRDHGAAASVAGRPATSQFVDLRGMRHHVLTWGEAAAPKLFLVHGWMDVGASFQFLVDALAREWHVIAPDLRGFGRSEWQPQGYWFHDYIADLEALVDRFAPGEQVNLGGHSLGGNVVMHYAGVRPARVRRLVSLDGFGIPNDHPDAAVRKSVKWLDALSEAQSFKSYDDLAGVAARLQQTNPRLARDKAMFLASYWAEIKPDGRAHLNSDPRHKLPFPTTYRMEEVERIWGAITAPTLWVAGAHSHILQWLDPAHNAPGGPPNFTGIRARMALVRGARLEVIPDAGHMIHHDRPDVVARIVEPFLAGD